LKTSTVNSWAFCYKSSKFVTEVENHIAIKSGYWATTDLIFGDLCGHFCVQSFSLLYLSPFGIIQATVLNVGIKVKVYLQETT